MVDHVRNLSAELLSDNWYILKKYTFEHRRADGTWQPMVREAYDRGNGAVVLPYDTTRGAVILTRQFRLPVFVNGHPDGMLIEAPAGLLDGAEAANRIRDEAMEETGYRLARPVEVFQLYMSPGSVTERLHFFIAEVRSADKVAEGGGLAEESEDIEVLDIPFQSALEMVSNGEITDAKTVILLQHLALTKIL